MLWRLLERREENANGNWQVSISGVGLVWTDIQGSAMNFHQNGLYPLHLYLTLCPVTQTQY